MCNPCQRKSRIMNFKFSLAIATLLTPLLLIGCVRDTPEALLASAKTYLAKNDNKAAVIQIKNALQADPQLPEARYLLGKALLAEDNPGAAELELRKAQALKFSPDLVVPKLAAAMLAQGQYRKLTDELSASKLGVQASTADLQTSIAIAYAVQGKAEPSDAALKVALAADPGFVPALLVRARQKASRSDFEGALAVVEDAVKRAPGSADAWQLKGDILMLSNGKPELAMADYRKAIEIKRDFLPAHLSIVKVLAQQGKLDEAQKQLDQVEKFAANNPQTKYFEARIAYLRKNFQRARELSQQLLEVAPDSAEVLFLAGSVEFQSNHLAQAEAYLTRAVQLAPQAMAARQFLVMTYLRSNQPDKALAALHSGKTADEVSPELYSVAAEAYLQKGDFKAAEKLYSKASRLDPTDARKRTAVALMHLLDGKSPAGYEELQAIAESDNGTSADMALIAIAFERKDFEKALRAIDTLERKQPDRPLAATLRGRTLLAMQDVDGARKNFERALTIAPGYFPAVSDLAGLDVAAKRPQDAKKRIEAFLVKNPNNGQALVALAKIAAVSGAGKEEVTTLLGKAISANPTDSEPRLLLIELYVRSKNLNQAMSAAQNGVAALPDSAELMDALGRVQQESGDVSQAIASYNKLIDMLPNSPRPYLRLAEVHMASKNIGAADQNLRKALEIKPDLIGAQRGLVGLKVASGKFQEALAVAHTVQQQRPKEGVGFELEGDIDAAQNDWNAAATEYRTALQQAPSSELAVKLHSALLASRNVFVAEEFASDWRKDHPTDAWFLFHLGDSALTRKDYPAAEKVYIEVTRLQPKNAPAFNNLAWVTDRLHKEGAIAYAQTANDLEPNQPSFIDTLAMLLAEVKQYDKAIALQMKAMALEPSNPAWRLGLAKIYIQSGDRVGARRELDQLAALGAKYPAHAEVATLLKNL